MDQGLLSWARQVKQRQKNALPVLWLFTDAPTLPDPLPSIAKLPKGLCGVVFRHDAAPNRLPLGLRIAQLCKARRLALVVAGDARLAARLHAGVHLRGGRWPGHVRTPGLRTASAHNVPEIMSARRAQAGVIFISPAFATASHPGAKGLGGYGWRTLARQARPQKAYGLGGISGQRVKSLGPLCYGAASIRALVGAFS
ncbi:MAG: thiamine phosphate synthase [Acidocella sp. 20-57-95]|nr:MAG: thiamine phosphate synthase [Acidocella sp. 20-57-95]OYV62264.1 MAG: thiamine phosphate synthase [Acidocella sp. 21-58-7]HQT63081.1 thiamine phosphate synthase [Acidocella sp.]HQU03606.1 thiamine phosphate synthase [Acidocella sp.]